MGNKSFKEVGLEVRGDAIIYEPKAVLLKYSKVSILLAKFLKNGDLCQPVHGLADNHRR